MKSRAAVDGGERPPRPTACTVLGQPPTPSRHFPLMRVPVKVLASPPLKPPRRPRFPPLLSLLVVPSPWDAPRPPPSEPGLRAGPSCHFTFPRRLPTPSPDQSGSPPGRAPAPAPSRPRAGGGGAGEEVGARRRTADVGLALSRSLPGGCAGTRTRGCARGRPGGGGSRRWWLHFPGLRGSHSDSRGQQPQEPELERPGEAAAAALRVSPGGRERGGDRRGRVRGAWVRLSVTRRSAGDIPSLGPPQSPSPSRVGSSLPGLRLQPATCTDTPLRYSLGPRRCLPSSGVLPLAGVLLTSPTSLPRRRSLLTPLVS